MAIVSRRRVWPLKVALPLVIGGPLVLAIAAFSLMTYGEVRHQAIDAARERLALVTKNLDDALQAGVRASTVALRDAASDPALRTYLRQRTAVTRAEAVAGLVRFSARTRRRGTLELWDAAGESLVSVGLQMPPMGPRTIQVLRASVSDSIRASVGPFRVVDDSAFASVIAEVKFDTQTVGYLVEWRRLGGSATAARRLADLVGPGAHVLLGDITGDTWTDTYVSVQGPPVDVTATRGVIEYARPSRGGQLAHVSRVSGTPWILVIEFPREQVLAHARTFLGRMAMIALGLLGLGGVAAWALARQITTPLRQFGEAAGEVRFRSLVEERWRETSESYHTLDSMLEGCQIIGPDWRYLYVNDAAARHGRRPKRELLGRRMGEIYPGIEGTEMFANLKRCLAEHVPIHMENEFRYADNSRAWFELRLQPVPEGVFILSIDITDRKRAEEALRRSEERYRSLFEGVPIGLYRTTPQGQFLEANTALAQMLGLPDRESLLRSDATAFYADPEARQAWVSTMEHDGEVHGFELPYRRPDGRVVTLSDTGRVHRAADGSVEYYEGVLEDVTQGRTLEAQFRQAQKMEAVGRLAGGIAHDFNNLLTAILGYADLVHEDLSAGDPRRADVHEIQRAAQRAAELTRQLLAFSRQQVLEPRVLDLNDVVDGMDRLLRRLIGEDVELQTHLAKDLGRVRADPGQIEQVVVNLAVNSRDAMPEGGRLTIETADVELDPTYARAHDVVKPGRYVMLAVSDTGTGMDEGTKAHIFEPFFTTKEKGRGTGLGLATVYGIVKQSGGYVWVYSEPGRGTTFKVYLPRVESTAEHPIRAITPTEVRGGSERILLVEDDEGVRSLAHEVLRRHGYDVIVTEDGDAALALLAREPPGAVQLVLTDLIMPGLSGHDLMHAVARLSPPPKILFISGYTDRAAQAQTVFPPGTPFLQKPFTPTVLARKVREVLDTK